MAISDRYYNRAIRRNSSRMYEKILRDNRGLENGINQFVTAEFDYPTPDEMSNFTILSHTWKISDKFYKIADKHYGSPKLWWVIAWFNRTPTESDMRIGDVVHIAHPLDGLLPYFGI